jgi:hypothetical protein
MFEQAFNTIDNKLRQLMIDAVTDDWLYQVEFRHKVTKVSERLTTTSLWGGYTPDDTK